MSKITLIDLLIEKKKRQQKYFKNYLGWARAIKRNAQKILGEVKVYLFGSIIRGEAEPGSDIDILIISRKARSSSVRSKAISEISKKLGDFSPFEIHLVTPEEYTDWYAHFIKEFIEV